MIKGYKNALRDAIKQSQKFKRDIGLEYNELWDVFFVYILPDKNKRFGRELACEVVPANSPMSEYLLTIKEGE